MYITASWVQAPNKDLGTNILAHSGFSPDANLGEAPTIEAAKRVADKPGPEEKKWRRDDVPPRMNRVLAYVDIVLDEQQGPVADRIRRALEAHKPSSDEWAEHEGVFVQFFQQPYMAAREDTYSMLKAQLERWLERHFPDQLAEAG